MAILNRHVNNKIHDGVIHLLLDTEGDTGKAYKDLVLCGIDTEMLVVIRRGQGP